jgi:hypothetical protein
MKFVVGSDMAVVTDLPGDRRELNPGARIFVAAADKHPDGTLQTARFTYGKDDKAPPM